jgi:Tol biopolymer transport system component
VALAPGTRIGVYEIVSPLGAGGMGEVFRAKDTRLGRSVAVKVLPAEFAADPDRRARFEREAKTLATLNHPHIAQIFGLEDVPASDGQPASLALAMELVEGEDLATRIARGPLPLDEAIPLARQIAEALEAAHEAGIVHRDLKPANIRVTPEGTVKVLDFGLAKALDAPGSDGTAGATHSPTLLTSPAMTLHGVILGTAGYMAPEQARGRPIDRRADIWAFGCVLYELVTGRRAFEGEDLTETLAAIVKSEPDWTRLPAAMPPRLRTLLQRCLTKDRAQRLQHIGDARLELADPLDPPVAPASRPASRLVPAVWALAGAAGSAALLLLTGAGRTAPAANAAHEIRLDIATPPTTDPMSFAIAPDARTIAFVATEGGQPKLWVRPLAEDRARVLAGTDGASYPFWSSDSRSIGFFSDGRVKRIDVDGASLQALVATAALGQGGTWSADGTILFPPAAIGARIVRTSATGGPATPVTTLTPGQRSHRFPVWLPDGRRFLFYAAGAPNVRGVYLSVIDGGPPTRLLDADGAAAFDALRRRLLFVRQGVLYAQAIDLDTSALIGAPERLAEGIAVRDAYGAAAISAASDGTLVYRTGSSGGFRQYVWVDAQGRELARLGQPDPLAPLNPALSPDGRQVAFSRVEDGATDVWGLDAERGILERLTSGEGVDTFAVWARVGRRLIFRRSAMLADGSAAILEAPAIDTGTTTPHEVAKLGIPQDVSPDGRFLATRRGNADTGDLWAEPLDGSGQAIPIANSTFPEYNATFAPVGGWVAYQTTESGRSEIVVQRFPEPLDRTRVSAAGGGQPQWSPDSRAIYYIALDGMLTRVTFAPTTSGAPRIGSAEPMFMTRIGGALQGMFRAQYAVAPDGRRFLMNTLVEEPSTPPLTIGLGRARPAP